MSQRTYWIIFSIGILLLFISIASVAAAQNVNDQSEMIVLVYNPEVVQEELLKQFIRKYNPSLNEAQVKLICDTIFNEATQTNFEPFFISSIIAAESSFFPKAVSRCEALGLMQLTSPVLKSMNIQNPFDISENIYGGTRFLKYLKSRFSDTDLILAAYNAGPTRVARLQRIPNIPETVHYVKKVNSLYKQLSKNFQTAMADLVTQPTLCPWLTVVTKKNMLSTVATITNLTQTNINLVLLDICENRRSFQFAFSI